jgi:hypothetical protein
MSNRVFSKYKTRRPEVVEAAIWDGEYTTYRTLLHAHDFVGILHDGGERGKDTLKVFDKTSGTWLNCPPGHWVVCDSSGHYSVCPPDEFGIKYGRAV